jgi:hypothetical protein
MNKKIALIASLLLTSSIPFAASFTTSGMSFGDFNTGNTINSPTAAASITQNTDSATITAANSVACPIDNDSYYRRFDLDGDHAITTVFNVASIDFGVESSTGNNTAGTELIVNLYSIPNASPLLLANLTLIGTANVSVADTGGTPFIQNALVTGGIDGSTDDLVVEVLANDTLNATTFFIGSNAAGQIAPTFLLSAACGAAEPTDVATLGFPGMHQIMVVNGDVVSALAPPTPVPSLTWLGLALLVLTLGFFGRRFVK